MATVNNNVKTAVAESQADNGSAPSRYQIIKKENRRCLQCINSSNLRLYVERKLSVDEAERRSYPDQSIFIDGVYIGAPFLDNKLRQYSLDHHSNCVRSFTLSSCEQAAVMLLDGLPLSEGGWSLYINEPDLDALLAVWLLLNHREMLKEERTLLRAAMPMLRIEGIIDAHGLDKTLLAAMPDELFDVHKRAIDRLLSDERHLRAEEKWSSTDFVTYTASMLDKLDRLFLTDSYLYQLLEVEEIQSLPVEGNQVAILCRSTRGIYEAELALKERYGKQLGIVLLDKGHGHYTLRQVDRFLHYDLGRAYKLLNRLDPKVDSKTHNQWGGSEEIGGSPRSTGSGLTAATILILVQKAYQRRQSVWRRLWHWMSR